MNLKYLLLIFAYIVILQAYEENPYNILGITPSATQKEIKKAHKALVKEWHPDRNTDPKANEKFVRIQKAYEILNDPKKKANYDRFGTVDDTPQHQHQRYHGFHDFFNFGGFGGSGESSFFENHSITYRMYMNSILEKSHTQPFIIFGYSPYCHFCYRMEGIWKDAVTDLEALGYGIGTVNAMTDGLLLEKLRVTSLPSLTVLIEGRVVHYRKSFNGINAKAIRLFARDTIPTTFLQRITTHTGLRRFLDQWQSTNKVSVLMIGAKEDPRLRYYLTSMKYSHFARFAYISLFNQNSEIISMKKALGIKCHDCENILVFKEDPKTGDSARISIQSGQFTVDEISKFLNKEKFLNLPRISSMEYFDELCPVSSRSLRHYCVILMTTDSNADSVYVDTLRRYLAQHPLHQNSKIHLVYMYRNKQSAFIDEFPEVSENLSNENKGFLILWRNEYVKVKYTWWGSIWTKDKLVEYKTFELLKEKLHSLDRGNVRLEKQAKVVPLVNEYESSWYTKLCRKIVRMVEMAFFYVTKEEALPILSIIGTFAIIMLIGFVLNYATNSSKLNETNPGGKTAPKEWHPEDPKTGPKRNESMKSTVSIQSRRFRDMQPLIHELKAETQFGLIRLLKPGCRSIILLVDKETKDLLLPKFAAQVWPLRNNKTFSFGYLSVDKNLQWFRTLLENILPTAKDYETGSISSSSTTVNPLFRKLKDINPKHTLGTVLILCGYKLYFSMYHPMYKISKLPEEYDTTSEESDSEKKLSKKKMLKDELNVDNVLNGFPNFLDRLLEGSVPRFYLPEWPDNLR